MSFNAVPRREPPMIAQARSIGRLRARFPTRYINDPLMLMYAIVKALPVKRAPKNKDMM